MLNHLVSRRLDPQRLKLVIPDENSGCDEAILTILGQIPQQACAVHLERNIGEMVPSGHTEVNFRASSLRCSSSPGSAQEY